MNTEYLTPRDAKSISVLQLTDPHLFADRQSRLLGIVTAESFQTVLGAIRARGHHYDFIIVTGDISQDYSAGSYALFADLMREMPERIFFVPGNHDDGPLMYRIFPELTSQVSTAKHLIAGSWQFVFLNSEVYGVPHGWLQMEEIERVYKAVAEHPDLKTVICLHHYPHLVGSAWLDTQTLHNKQEFLNAVEELDPVRLVLCGHVHQARDFTCGGVRYLSSPSTSIQFEPRSDEFRLDHGAPGWRELTLGEDGSIGTELFHLPEGIFVPDSGMRGY